MTVSILPRRLKNRKYREIRVDGDTAFVTLTKGYEAVIDAEDAPLLDKRNWCAFINPCGAPYAKTRVTREDGVYDEALMHRVLLAAPDHLEVDHIDGDTLNNRKVNLRLATNQQNLWNQKLRARNTSGFKGVSWSSRDEVWQVHIRVSDRRLFLGYFDKLEEAAMAYDDAARVHHGAFANPNCEGAG